MRQAVCFLLALAVAACAADPTMGRSESPLDVLALLEAENLSKFQGRRVSVKGAIVARAPLSVFLIPAAESEGTGDVLVDRCISLLVSDEMYRSLKAGLPERIVEGTLFSEPLYENDIIKTRIGRGGRLLAPFCGDGFSSTYIYVDRFR